MYLARDKVGFNFEHLVSKGTFQYRCEFIYQTFNDTILKFM